ncbi:hypothetical protein HRR83_000980 [Exophiala dermatitidis]|uniref:PHD-type domain-containing protein n=2 Tax=Exophiala dermatitidis TaxID=5970 RepID=H6CBS3_EXODN|nr:uncharacterized protein HMPREF1120_09156 [Exophiala dermatitidis NIH/UT8656]KAJ4525301.1 hypothetical protein HRR75_000892 [Exophiala dermatitidis]EHY61220.1 hypothetical protein HMPREF1120_09156 [Exophiala dermatitidis NIH/UT8656]KAJ4528229.1 hypothetical protein HRR74_000984 [Exophiala dermatitidis]KAJ4528862.1 hypothetical protein HRR73_001485 [Exophiala dermatitidis]KAJ4530253.1 hypothetical protein HRR76_009481 [Exophiala dermatitidis]
MATTASMQGETSIPVTSNPASQDRTIQVEHHSKPPADTLTSSSTPAMTIGNPQPDTMSLSAIPQDAPSISDSNMDVSNQDVGSQSNSGQGPRRGSFPDILPRGHTLPRLIDAGPPSDTVGTPSSMLSTFPPQSSHDDLQTDSDPEIPSAANRSSTSLAPRSTSVMTEDVENSTITVSSQSEAPTGRLLTGHPAASVPVANTSSNRNKNYVLPDGSVVSGKGLGRGRPGIKRGPRNQKQVVIDHVPSQSSSTNAATVSSDAGLPPRKKRKSGDPDGGLIKPRASTSASVTATSRESSVEYTPTATQTRSGRHTQKPASLANTTPAAESPSKRPGRPDRATSTTSASPSTLKLHPKIKRRVYRGREQFALCEHCLRGHGPPGNVIVFCDACNKCWHQRCHDPLISKQTVSDAKAEWFCADCDRILHGGKKAKKPPAKRVEPTTVSPIVIEPTLGYGGPRVGGRSLNPEQRLAYLRTLSKDDLISLILEASDLAPDLPLYKALVPLSTRNNTPQAQFTSTYVTPVSQPPTFADKDTANNAVPVDEGYDDHLDDHATLYPKPGNGVQLPPESEDLHMLLEGKDSKTFSHWVRGMGGNDFSGTGNVVSSTQAV